MKTLITNIPLLLVVLLTGFFSTKAYSQNTCGAPQIIASLPYSLASGTTCGTLNDYNTNLGLGGSTFYTTGEDLIFRFVPATSGNITISVTQPSGAWLGMYLYTGCPFTAYIGGVQDNNLNKSFTVAVTAGTTYFLRLDHYANPTCSSFTNLTISAPAPPNCANSTAFATVNAPTNSTALTISTCTFQTNYNTINSVVAGTQYQSTYSLGGYITVRSGTFNGPIVAQGNSPLTWTAGVSGTHFIHYNTNSSCGTASNCGTSTIQCMSCVAPPPPANDACANATALPCGTSNLAGTTVNSVSETVPTGAGSNFGVWYTFTGDGQSTTITSTTTFDHRLTVFTGACGTSTILVSQDGSTGTETVTFNTVNGTQYRVYVSHYLAGSTTTGTFNISRSCTPLAYDPCTSIPVISGCGVAASASMNGTGAGWNVTSCGYSTPGQERLFQFTAPSTGTYSLNVTAISGGFIDFFWKAASGGCNATGWNCIDDISATGTYNAITPMTFTAGTTYYLLLDPEGSGTYSATFNLGCPVPVPANDLCSGATSLACGASGIAGTTAGAVAETAPASADVGNLGVWYSFVGNGQQTTISSTGTGSFDHQMVIYTGTSCSSFCIIGSQDVGAGGGTETFTFTAINGQQYYVYIADWLTGSSTSGSFTISRTCTAPPAAPSNDNCINAQNVSVQCQAFATATNGTTLNATSESSIANPSCDACGIINDVWYTFFSGNNTSLNLTVTLGTASLLGGQLFTSCGTVASTVSMSGTAGACDFNLGNPSPTVISGLTPNTQYRLRLFTNDTYDTPGTFSFTLTANDAAPTASITPSGPTALCAGQTVTLTANSGPGYTYQWQLNGSTSWYTQSVTAGVATQGNWTVTVFNASGCNSAVSSPVNVSVTPLATTPSVSANSTTICPNSNATLTASPFDTWTQVQWYTGPNGTGTLLGTGYNLSVSPQSTTTYYVRKNNFCGSSGDASITISVNNPTISSALSNGDMVWQGNTSTDWATISNWWLYNGTFLTPATLVPITSTNVILPSAQTCVLNQPSLGSNTVNAKNVTIESGATLSLNTGTLNITGHFVNNGTLNAGTGTVAFIGTTTQNIDGTTPTSFYNLTVNNSHTGAYPNHVAVKLVQDATVNNNLTLTDGILDVFDKVLTLGTTTTKATISPALGTADSYVAAHHNLGHIGYVKQFVHNSNIGNGTAYGFPIGDDGKWTPYNLTFDTGTSIASGSFITSHVNDALVAGSANNNFVSRIVRDWEVEPSAGITTPNYTIEIFHNQSPTETGGLASSGSVPFKKTSGTGQLNAPTNALGINSPSIVEVGTYTSTGNSFTWTGLTSFSNFGGTDVNQALPIELVSFQANCIEDNSVAVTWTTASEHNTSHYVVEKSRDGINWSVLGQTAAAGNSTQLLNYEMIDSEKANGTTYYRLTQYDNDGVYELFDPVSVNCNGTTTNNHITTYPNPSLDGFYVSLFTETMDGNGQLRITDGSGRTVYSKSVNIQDGNNVFHIGDLNAAPGMYYIQVSNGTTTTDIVKHSLR